MKLSHFEILIFYRNKIFREESFFGDHVKGRKDLTVHFEDYRYKLKIEDVYNIYLKQLQGKRDRRNSDVDYEIKENIEEGIWRFVKQFNDSASESISYNAFSGIDKEIIKGVCTYLYDIGIIKDNPYFGINHRIAHDVFLKLGLIKEKTRRNKLKEENEKLKKELEELKKELKKGE